MSRSSRLGWSAVAVVLVSFGLLSNHWWTLDIGGLAGELGVGVSGSVGLRGSEACIAGTCQVIPIPTHGRGGIFATLVQVTYGGGFLVVVMLVAGTAVRELRGESRAARLAGASCVALMLCSILTVIVGMSKSTALGSLTPSYAGAVVVVGCLLGAYASRLDASAWDGSGAAPVAVRLPAREPTTPTSTARQLSHDLDAQIRDAARSVAPRSVKAARMQGASAVADASIDAVRSTLRFVALSIEIGESGLTAVLDGNQRHELAFTEITQVIARRLPADPPFDRRGSWGSHLRRTAAGRLRAPLPSRCPARPRRVRLVRRRACPGQAPPHFTKLADRGTYVAVGIAAMLARVDRKGPVRRAPRPRLTSHERAHRLH